MSLQNMFALKKTKSPVSKNPYINYLRHFRLQHRELSYKEQLREALASWRQLTAEKKAAYHARNFKISYKESNTDTEAESTKATDEHEVDTLSNAAAMTAMVMATVSNTASNNMSNVPAAAPPPTPLPRNCNDNKTRSENEHVVNEIKWPKIHCITCTNNTNYHQHQQQQQQEQQQQQRQHIDIEMPSISVSESESNFLHLDTIARVSSWNLSFDGFYNPLEFIERLEELAQVFQMDYEQLPSMMPVLLTRKALVWYRNSQRRWSGWSAFKRDLFNFFLPPRFEEQQANAIRQRRQREGETIKNFVLSLQNLMRYTDMSEEDQLERIYESLRPELRLYVKRQDFVTLAELIALGSECEEIRAQLFKCERRKSCGRGVGVGAKHAPLDNDICRCCGAIGHWAHECPNQRKNYSWEYGNDYWTPVHTWYRKSDELRKRAKAHKRRQRQSSDESSDESDEDESDNDDNDDDDEDEDDDDEADASKCPCKRQSGVCRPLKRSRKLRTFMHVMHGRDKQMPASSERNFNSNKTNDCKSNNEPKSSHDSSTETDVYTTSSIPKRAMYIKRSHSA